MPLPVSRAVVFGIALAAQSAALWAAPSPKPDAAGPVGLAPNDRLTSDEIKDLRESIKGLLVRFERQGTVLEELGKNVSTITARVDDDLPVKLDPLKASIIAETVRRSDDVKTALAKLAGDLEKNSQDTAGQYREIAATLARLQEEAAKSDRAAGEAIADLRKTIALSHNAAATVLVPAENAPPLLPLLAAILAATLVLAALMFFHGGAQRRAQRAALEQMAAALAQARDALLAEIQAHPPVAAGASASVPAAPGPKPQPVPVPGTATVLPVNSDDHTTKNFSTQPSDERATVHHPVPAGGGISSAACWPAVFLDPASPLSAWRERIESHLASNEHPALPVFSAFLALRLLCSRQPAPLLPETSAAVVALSQTLYSYWDSLPDLSDDDRARANSDWIQAIKALVSTPAPKLEIREIIVGARFDSDSMQTVQEGPGSHLNVAAVFSWATLDRSGERVKIVHRARIATN